MLDLLPLDAASRVLDLGCGRAELALQIIERFGSTVIAIDNSSYMLDAARERAEWTGALGQLHLDDTDIRDFRADPETFHFTVMLDAGGIAGGMAGICQKLRGWTRSGGYVLVGVGYWKRKPPGELVAMLGGRQKEIHDHAGNVQAGIAAGLIPMHAVTATMRRMGRLRVEVLPVGRALRARAAGRPRRSGDGGSRAPLARRLSRWGRESLGFAAYLFYRPGTRIG